MIICPHCERATKEAKFCFHCGKPLRKLNEERQPDLPEKMRETPDTPTEPKTKAGQSKLDEWGDPITQPEMTAVVSGFLAKMKPGRTLSSIPDMNDLKQRATSWFFLGFLLAFSLFALFELITALSGSYSLFTAFDICADLIGRLTDSYLTLGYYSIMSLIDMEEASEVLQSLRIIIRLVCFVPTGFTLYGVWHFYVSSANEKTNRINLKGLKSIDLVFKYYSVVQLIYGVVAAGMVAAAGIIALEDYYYDEEEAIQLIISAVSVLLYYVFNFAYVMKFRSALRIIAKTVKNGAYHSKATISNYVIAWNIVLCVISLFFVCNSYNAAAHLFETISLVLITVVLVGYNKKVQGKSMSKMIKSNSEFDFDELNG